jgi:alanine-synthesizing transaminase
VEGAKEIAVEIFSMSKSYNMAGWRVGFCLGNAKMIAALARIKSYLDYGVFQPIQIASIIALRECEEDTEKIRALYQHRRDLLVEGLRRAGWPVESPRGSMFLWAPVPEEYREDGSLEFAKLLMKEALVAVSPGIGLVRWARVSGACAKMITASVWRRDPLAVPCTATGAGGVRR